MFWPACIFFPRKFLLWNLPGKNYFDDILKKIPGKQSRHLPQWIYQIIHCIPVDRDGENRKEVLKKATCVLEEGFTLVIFGEMGRTGSKPRNQPDAAVEFVYSDNGQRQVRPFTAALIKLAANEETDFITAWTKVLFWKESPGFGLKTWLQGRHCVTITFSDSYKPDLNLRGSDLKADTQKRVLHTQK
jgi:1-acyl-sn-glycerol-3-phosphate acyltransferase